MRNLLERFRRKIECDIKNATAKNRIEAIFLLLMFVRASQRLFLNIDLSFTIVKNLMNTPEYFCRALK